MRRQRAPRAPKWNREATAQKALEFTYKLPRFLGYGRHWDLEPDESKEYAEALTACLNTLPASKLASFDKLVTKWLPWVSLATVGINVTVPRVQQTRMEMARAKALEARQAAINRGEIYETVRTSRADQGAPIIDSQADTIATTTGHIEETRPVDPFGQRQADDGTQGRAPADNSGEPPPRLFG